MILAQADALGAYSAVANLGAVGVALTLLIYIVVWGWPKMTEKIDGIAEKFTETLKDQRDDFAKELREDRDAFREELQAAREQSNRLASSGHESVNNLASEISQLRTSLKAK